MASSNEHKDYEVYGGISTREVPSAKWGYGSLKPTTIRTAGWVASLFLLGMLFGNHKGNQENYWLIVLAVLMMIALVWWTISPSIKQKTTVSAHNKAQGHAEPRWAIDQHELTGAYADLTPQQRASLNLPPQGNASAIEG